LQIRPNPLCEFRKQSTYSHVRAQEAECPLIGGAVVLTHQATIDVGKGTF